MKYDFIEVGTSDFDTLLESTVGKVGLSIDPLKVYQDNLPDRDKVTKVNCAISDFDGETDVFWVSPDDIEKHDLPWWLRGCSSIAAPHPTAQAALKERNLLDIHKTAKCKCMTWSTLVATYDVTEVDYLKLDTEGHDCKIIQNILASETILPEKINFEYNQLTDQNEFDTTMDLLFKAGYELEKYNAGDEYDNDVIVARPYRHNFTIVIAGSYIKSHPDTEHIVRVIDSCAEHMGLGQDDEVPVVLAHDYNEHDDFKKYLENLETYTSEYESNSNMFRFKVVVSDDWGCLTGNLRHSMKYVDTKYMFVVQHDLYFTQSFGVYSILADMEFDRRLKHIRFNLAPISKKYADGQNDLWGKVIQHKNSYVRTPAWSDNNHLTTKSYYQDYVLHMSEDGDWPETNIIGLSVDERTHAVQGTYIYGNIGDGPKIDHSDGRKEEPTPNLKARWFHKKGWEMPPPGLDVINDPYQLGITTKRSVVNIDKIVYINRDCDVAKRNRMDSMLDDVGIPYERFEAIVPDTTWDSLKDPSDPYNQYYERLAPGLVGEDGSYQESPKRNPIGVLGTYLSHYSIWKYHTGYDGNLLILEDDCEFDSSILETFLVAVCTFSVSDWDIFRVCWENCLKLSRGYWLDKPHSTDDYGCYRLTKHNSCSKLNDNHYHRRTFWGGAHFTLINKFAFKKGVEAFESDNVYGADGVYSSGALDAVYCNVHSKKELLTNDCWDNSSLLL